jgi:hypothetical protein
MKQLVYALITLFALTFGWSSKSEASGITDTGKVLTSMSVDVQGRWGTKANLPSTEQSSRRDMLLDARAVPARPVGAMLSDAQDVYRVCSSRPQRLVPTYGPRPVTYSNKPSRYGSLRKPLLRQVRCAARQETAPFQTPSSCDYYVIALRRIIC